MNERAQRRPDERVRRCGALLTKEETRIALETLFRRIPSIKLDEEGRSNGTATPQTAAPPPFRWSSTCRERERQVNISSAPTHHNRRDRRAVWRSPWAQVRSANKAPARSTSTLR